MGDEGKQKIPRKALANSYKIMRLGSKIRVASRKKLPVDVNSIQ
jgi:hypothetical protein